MSEKIRNYIVPDLTDFHLKPYVTKEGNAIPTHPNMLCYTKPIEYYKRAKELEQQAVKPPTPIDRLKSLFK